MLFNLLNNIWLVFLDTAFWLLVGLLAAGIIKSFISENTMQRWVGGNGIGSIFRAALFGAPLPLCSCGVLPAAIGMHRSGASKEATVAFLISTPETSVDSVAVTYALMGPVMAVFRPVAALFNAIGTGLLTTLIPDEPQSKRESAETSAVTSCCAVESNTGEATPAIAPVSGLAEEIACCGSTCAAPDNVATGRSNKPNRLLQVISYAGADLLDDISTWMAIGIVLAGVMLTFVPPDWFAQWGQGISAMLLMLVVGVPLYICAVASTPIAASLLIAGVSPGAVLVFLLVGPATNIASFALLKRELGLKVTAVYLAGLSVLSLVMGLLLEWLLEMQQWQIEAKLGEAQSVLPSAVAWVSAFILIFLAIKPLRRAVLPQLG
jgi:uncharacterized membrane protein YraQ (UPF0718 family)